MNKNILILLLSLLCLVAFGYGFYQQQRADQQEAIALENAAIAEQAVKLAEKQKAEAQRAIEQARINEMIATVELNKRMEVLAKKK